MVVASFYAGSVIVMRFLLLLLMCVYLDVQPDI